MAVLFLSKNLAGQAIEKGETIFGLEVKGIIPTDFFGAGPIELGNDSISASMKSPYGFSFGMIIRHNFTKMFTVESGIHLNNRTYPVSISNSAANFNASSKISLQSYEIPIQWLLYIRLGKQFYMNTILGLSLDFYPSDVSYIGNSYAYYIQRDSWIKAGLVASLGFEYRTKKMGYWYLGGSIHSPFGNIGDFYISYYNENNINEYVTFSSGLNGTFFSVELRYFFNKSENNVDKAIN